MSYRPPKAVNEPVRGYAPGSIERASLQAKLAEMASQRIEFGSVIGGHEVRTGNLAQAVMPHQRGRVLADVHMAGAAETQRAIAAARDAWHDWSRTPFEDRAAIFLRAADLLSGPWRDTLNAATMLGQSKTAHQAEIDSACELIDFWRFNVEFAARIYDEQP
ncbi:MAG TPA: aldehyde dehydrogenase family protein, partial [Chloroflexota bacterium]|nr:aldehyde dehydrogenase family protein [Chloroflexota bacterium]